MKTFPGKDPYSAARKRMVREQLSSLPPAVRVVMGRVPRQEFIPEDRHALAYADTAVPIGYGQTISQPYIVAAMTSQLDPQPTNRVLEIGTGSGYQSAVLAPLVAEVYSIEIIEPLAQRAADILRRLGCDNVHLRVGDGSDGWPEASPFDAVIVTCAPEAVPPPLIAQLKDGGRMVIPVGPLGGQQLLLYQKYGNQFVPQSGLPVRFVPMTGKAEPARRNF